MATRAQHATCPECGADTWWAIEHADRIKKCTNGHYWTYATRTSDGALLYVTIAASEIQEVDGVPYVRTADMPDWPPPPALQIGPGIFIESHL
jgi:ribosomal protein S27AE